MVDEQTDVTTEENPDATTQTEENDAEFADAVNGIIGTDEADEPGEDAADEPSGDEEEPDGSEEDATDEDDAPVELTAREKSAARMCDMSEEEMAMLPKAAREMAIKLTSNIGKRHAELGNAMQKVKALEDVEIPDDLSFSEDDLFGDEDGNLPKLNTLAKTLIEVKKRLDERDQRDQKAEIDGFFNELGDEYGDVSEDSDFRSEVEEQAEILLAGAQVRSKDISRKDALEQALAIVAGDRKLEAERKKLVSKAKKRGKNISPRPSQRQGGKTVDRDAEYRRQVKNILNS